MANSANNNAAQLIRQQIANLQEVLAILEAKPIEILTDIATTFNAL